MRPLLATLTASLLLIHAWLGCCWHHAHACGQAGCADRPHTHGGHDLRTSDTGSVVGARDSCDEPQQPSRDHLPADQHCHGNSCVFLGANSAYGAGKNRDRAHEAYSLPLPAATNGHACQLAVDGLSRPDRGAARLPQRRDILRI